MYSAIRNTLQRFWRITIGKGETQAIIHGGSLGQILSGVVASNEQAVGLPACFQAINIQSTNIATMSLPCYRRDGRRKTQIYDHPNHRLLNVSPDGKSPAIRWRTALLASTLSHGNGYAEIERRNDGKPYALHLLDPRCVEPFLDPAGNLFYRVQNRNGKTVNLPHTDVIHIAGLSFDGLKGLSPIACCRRAISMGIAAEVYGSAFFGNAARPGGTFKQTQQLTAEAMKQFAESWKQTFSGPDAVGRSVILPFGLEWQAMTIDPDEAQWIQSMQFSIQQVARIFNIPSHKLNDKTGSTFSNVAEMNLDFYISSLLPWCEAVEQELNLKLWTPEEQEEYFCEHNMKSLLRADDKSRSERYKTMFSVGGISINEIAELENNNPIDAEWADFRFVPVNMLPANKVEAWADGLANKGSYLPDPMKEQAPIESSVALPAIAAASQPAEQLKIEHQSPIEETKPFDNTLMIEATRQVLLSEVERTLRRECNALKKAAKQPDTFLDWFGEFYANHERYIAEALAPSLNAYALASGVNTCSAMVAECWTGEHTQAVLFASGSEPDASLPDNIGKLTDEWLQTRATQIVDAMG